MYAWIWRSLPGRTAAKLAESLLLFLGVLALLFFVVFPIVEPRLPWNNSTVDAPSISQSSSPGASASPTIPAG